MFTEFWKSLGGSFDKRWLINAFGPALVFWGAGLWVWAQMVGPAQAIAVWNALDATARVFVGAAGLLLVFFTALLLEAFEGGLLRFYEGYWPRRPRAARRRAADLERKLQRRHELRTRLVSPEAPITPQERAELARLNSELAHRPAEPGRSMPTRLGDILRTAEDYPRDRYGLDPITFWPRLYPHLGDSLREALGEVQDQLDLTLRLNTLIIVYGVVWSAIVTFCGRWPVLVWTLPALLLAWPLRRAADQAASSYGELFRAAFDLHRFDAYEKMHWPKPTSPKGEKEHGEKLLLYLQSGRLVEDISYVHDSEAS